MPPDESTRKEADVGHRLYIVAASEWGQQACERFLHSCINTDGHVTIIIPRKDQDAFENWSPVIPAWKDKYDSVKKAIDALREQGGPVGYVYDDHLDGIRARMIRERYENYLVAVYITSSSDRHIEDASAFVGYAERILIEKPYTLFIGDLRDGSPYHYKNLFENSTEVYSAEHYLFRPGITAAFTLPEEDQVGKFLSNQFGLAETRGSLSTQPWLNYEFIFEEKSSHDDPNKRLNAYKDGSIMDIAVIHGLGPISRILLPALKIEDDEFDISDNIKWTNIEKYQATENEKPKVATLVETAVTLKGVLTLPRDKGKVNIYLRSAKGAKDYQRKFRFSVVGNPDTTYYGVSLGDSGLTYRDGSSFREHEGGEDSDNKGRGRSGAANAQATMLEALFSTKGSQLNRLLMPIRYTTQVLKLAFRAQLLGPSLSLTRYEWGAFPKYKNDTNDSKGKNLQCSLAKSIRFEDLWNNSLDTSDSINNFLLNVWSFTESEPMHRFISFLGVEGEGNTDIARNVKEVISLVFEKEDKPKLIHIPRDEQWANNIESESNSELFTFDLIIREIASYLNFVLPANEPPEIALRNYFEESEIGENKGLMIFNGVDRLQIESWMKLVYLLNDLPAGYRICLIGNRADRTAGLVIRSSEAYHWVDNLTGRDQFNVITDHKENCNPDSETIEGQVAYLSTNSLAIEPRKNLTIERQLKGFLRFIAADDIEFSNALDAIAVPDALNQDPGSFLDIISRLAVAHLSSEDFSDVRVLALLDKIDKATLRRFSPHIAKRIESYEPICGLFEYNKADEIYRLFPHVRRAVLSSVSEQEIRSDKLVYDRKRLILDVYKEFLNTRGSKSFRDHQVNLFRLLGGAQTESIPFRQERFRECILDLVHSFTRQRDNSADSPLVMDLLEKVIGDRNAMTDLDLDTRSQLLSISGALLYWTHTGNDDYSIRYEGRRRIESAYAIALVESELKNPPPIGTVKTEIVTGVRLLSARLYDDECWGRLVSPEKWNDAHAELIGKETRTSRAKIAENLRRKLGKVGCTRVKWDKNDPKSIWPRSTAANALRLLSLHYFISSNNNGKGNLKYFVDALNCAFKAAHLYIVDRHFDSAARSMQEAMHFLLNWKQMKFKKIPDRQKNIVGNYTEILCTTIASLPTTEIDKRFQEWMTAHMIILSKFVNDQSEYIQAENIQRVSDLNKDCAKYNNTYSGHKRKSLFIQFLTHTLQKSENQNNVELDRISQDFKNNGSPRFSEMLYRYISSKRVD